MEAAEALMAFRDGERSERAFTGALLAADGLQCLREIAGFLVGVGRAGGG
jgi:hypothetical protein